jgi:hypothetical protein
MAYEHQPYPSVRYHASGATKLVHSEEESESLKADTEWSDTPATFADVKHAEPNHRAADQPTETGEYAKNARVKSLQPRKPANKE